MTLNMNSLEQADVKVVIQASYWGERKETT